MNLKDMTTSWLHEVCHDMAIEPPLQPLNDETLVSALEMMLRQIFKPEVFEVDDRVHF